MILQIIGIIFAVIIGNYLFNEWEEYKSRGKTGGHEDLKDGGYCGSDYGSYEDPYDSFEDKNRPKEEINHSSRVSEKEWKVPAFLRKKSK